MTFYIGVDFDPQQQLGPEVKNVLDDNGDLSMVESKKTANGGYWNYAQNFTYNSVGAVTSMQLGNGTWEKTVFNSRLQPTQIALGKTPGAVDLLNLEYEYGKLDPGTGQPIAGTNNGNLGKQKITVGAVGQNPGFVAQQYYLYDELNRIKVASETLTPTGQSPQQWIQQFDYDRFGNRTFDESVTTTLPKNCGEAVCAADRKIYNPSINPATNRLNTSDDYAFDNAGNTTGDAQGRTFTYDGENKQVVVKNSSNTTIGEYSYDGDGKRVKKKAYDNITGVLTEETIFVYDASGKLIEEYSTNVAAPETAQVAYLTNDHLGSPRINTDRDGNVTSRHDYHPFGEEISTLDRGNHPEYTPDSVRKQFTGYERDGETGLDFAQARYYSVHVGRFSTTDPLGSSAVKADPQTWNRFTYTLNNPLNLIDPSGESPSTHTDRDGRVIEVLDDGDLNVYRHNDIDASSGQQVVVPLAGSIDDPQPIVEVMGTTAHWDEFRDHDNSTGAIMPIVAQGAQIRFGTSWNETINEKADEAKNMNLYERAQGLKPGQNFDIKVSADSASEGRMLNGEYATARSAGNYLAGFLGATGTLGTVSISENTMLRLSGALHRGQLTDGNAFRTILFGADYGREIPHAERQISRGFRDGVRNIGNRNNFSPPRW